MNPLDLRGPEFLALYGWLLGGAFALALALRHLRRPPDGDPEPRHLALGPVESAVLAGGADRGFDAAVTWLVSQGTLGVAGDGRLVRRSAKLPSGAGGVERALHGAAAQWPVLAHAVRGSCAAALDEVRARLVALGLVLDAPAARRVGRTAAAPLWILAALGLAKVWVGLSRHRPVGFLVLLLLVTAAIAFAVRLRAPLRTRLGDRVLARLRERHQALRVPRAYAKGRQPVDVALAVALFGAAALAANALPELRVALAQRPPWSFDSDGGPGSSASSCSSSSCSSSSSCGGGSGCGGCGGGSD